MNNKDNKLIYEAYIAEKVTKLSDAHLADIRAKFYPDDGDAMFDNVIAPALQASLESGELDSETWAHTGTDVDTDGLSKHLETLRHGTLGALTRRGVDAIKRTKDKLKHATKKVGSLKFQSPITKKPGKVYSETYDSVEEIDETKRAALLELSKHLDDTNAEVFQTIKKTLGGDLYLTKFLPEVLSWMHSPANPGPYHPEINDADSLVSNVINVFEPYVDPMHDAMEDILFANDEFVSAMMDVKRLYYNPQ